MSSRVTTSESALKEANSLFVDESFEAALVHYNESIELDESNTEAYLKRSACLYKLDRFTESLSDANKLLKIEPDNAKAFLRKGLACFQLEEFETARAAFEKGAALDPSNTQFRTWIRKCNAELEAEGGASSSAAPAAAVATPPPAAAQPSYATSRSAEAGEPPLQRQRTEAPVAAAPVAKAKARHEWYQTPSDVIVTILAKNVDKQRANVDIGDKSVDIKFPVNDSNDYALNLELANTVVPAQSKVDFLSTKIEIKLKKASAGMWRTLEDTGEKHALPAADAAAPTAKPPAPKKNWDAIAKEAIGSEKLEGEEGLNELFRNIFSGGDDDQRRAMQKSFVESGGTVLSTNWSEVGKGPVKGSAPDGMVMKNWNEK
eukprot:TRINITY_DN2797_c0_g1_i1.p1 TRINITY_DN2797_c0_g1~~TRINITY_DN2797_c0_g1_i1.p1  ORF type:complete len:375 (+),score=98.33 TRINITY_DN2797_c0_g1_i1:39-1163(+)